MKRRSARGQEGTPAVGEDLRVRIHAVAELTGVPEPTLRAWERRYGIPAPERTAAGYRLYGAREVELVREMRRLCDAGVAAAEAARSLTQRGAPVASAEASATRPMEAATACVGAILDAVRSFDDDRLVAETRRALFVGTAVEVLDQIVVPALHEVGDWWHGGELSIAQEHLASRRLGTLLGDLLRLVPARPGAPRAVLACFAEEDHELGLVGLALHLRTWGLQPVILGARTPPSGVRDAVSALAPSLVALSVTIAPGPARARELVSEYASATGGARWVVGGAGAAKLGDLVRSHGGEAIDGGYDELRREAAAVAV